MATYAVGDIHGNSAALADLLAQVGAAATADDTIVFLGDYIDRGPDSRGCIDHLLAFQASARAEVVFLLGNHDQWLLDTMRNHRDHTWLLATDAMTTIRSYAPAAADAITAARLDAGWAVYDGACTLPYDRFFDEMPAAHRAFFEGLLPSWRTAECGCSHGGVDPLRPWDEQAKDDFVWGGPGFPDRYAGDLLLLYGHRNNAAVDAEGWPHAVVHGRTIGLDTISHGVLTAVRAPDLRFFQSSRHRDTRA